MDIMQISSNVNYNISSSYEVKLNDKESLVYENNKEIISKHEDEKALKKVAQEEKKEPIKSKDDLSPDELRLISSLESRDAEVKAHEAAHQSGGASTGAATYTYQQGPDGKMYAIGGEVPISFQTGSTPQETIANARAVIASALAPANPSGQDMAVASSATVMMLKAQQQLARETNEQISGSQAYKDEANSQEQDSENSIEPFDISA